MPKGYADIGISARPNRSFLLPPLFIPLLKLLPQTLRAHRPNNVCSLCPALGSITSIRSQPVGTSSSLRVPTESLPLAARSPGHEGRHRWKVLPPHGTPRSPTLNKLLCRQVRGQEHPEVTPVLSPVSEFQSSFPSFPVLSWVSLLGAKSRVPVLEGNMP